MHMRPACLGRAALMIPVLVILAGCDLAMADLSVQETAEWRQTYQLEPGGRVEISNTNGPITVEPSGSRTVEVVATKSARGATAERARAALERVEIREEVSPSSVRIETRIQRASGGFGNGGAAVAYSVRVPSGAHVKVTSVNGRIAVARLRGDGRIDVETVNGAIEANDVAGSALDARTVNGGIHLDLARVPGGGVKAGSTNGSISLRLPADAKADVSARVVNGGIHADDLPIEASERSRRRFAGRLNGGGPQIDLEGTNGAIRLAAR